MDYYSYFCQEVVVLFYTDTQVMSRGEYGNISESDQRDLKGRYKICHNF